MLSWNSGFFLCSSLSFTFQATRGNISTWHQTEKVQNTKSVSVPTHPPIWHFGSLPSAHTHRCRGGHCATAQAAHASQAQTLTQGYLYLLTLMIIPPVQTRTSPFPEPDHSSYEGSPLPLLQQASEWCLTFLKRALDVGVYVYTCRIHIRSRSAKARNLHFIKISIHKPR